MEPIQNGPYSKNALCDYMDSSIKQTEKEEEECAPGPGPLCGSSYPTLGL